jgi:hypothetical protein
MSKMLEISVFVPSEFPIARRNRRQALSCAVLNRAISDGTEASGISVR